MATSKKSLVLGAKARAAITAALQGKSASFEGIAGIGRVRALKLSHKTLANIVYNMKANGSLVASKGSNGRLIYGLISEAGGPRKVREKPAPRRSIKLPDGATVQMDIVKSTGRVRLQIAGMCIEIGVV